MEISTILLEREVPSAWLHWTNMLTCTKGKDGSFSLHLIEESEFGKVQRTIANPIRSGKEMVNLLLSTADWSDLKIGREEIAAEICPRLAQLHESFAEAVERETTALRA